MKELLHAGLFGLVVGVLLTVGAFQVFGPTNEKIAVKLNESEMKAARFEEQAKEHVEAAAAWKETATAYRDSFERVRGNIEDVKKVFIPVHAAIRAQPLDSDIVQIARRLPAKNPYW